jgi:hypothetical protein
VGDGKEPGDLKILFESVRRESESLVPRYARALGELLRCQRQLTEGISS